MSARKNLVKQAKQLLKDKREDKLNQLSGLYRKFNDSNYEGSKIPIREGIDKLIAEITEIDNDLSRKDKKSSSMLWKDTGFKAQSKKNREIVFKENYIPRNISTEAPVMPWLQAGCLVKKVGSGMIGILIKNHGSYSEVLFGSSNENVKTLKLRPFDMD